MSSKRATTPRRPEQTEALVDSIDDQVRAMRAWMRRVSALDAPKREEHQQRVVLVDDSDDIRELYRYILDHDGRYEVVGEARDGEEAIRLAEETHPDTIVLDLTMPGVGGFDALAAIHEFAPEVRVVVVTATPAFEGERRARALGADAYIEKRPGLLELADLLAT